MNASALIAANIAAHTVDGATSQHMVAAAHERTIRALCQVIAQYRGTLAQAQAGCRIFSFPFGPAEVLVEAEYEAEERGDGWNDPHYPECWRVTDVLINGNWCSADLFSEDVIDGFQKQIEATISEERNAAAESRAEARALDRLAA
jgi:hypothetical protein